MVIHLSIFITWMSIIRAKNKYIRIYCIITWLDNAKFLDYIMFEKYIQYVSDWPLIWKRSFWKPTKHYDEWKTSDN